MSGKIGNSQKYEGNVKPSSIEKAGWEEDLYAGRFTEIPSNQQMRCDYTDRTDGQPVYLGFAPRSLEASEGDWLLHKFTYDGSERITLRQIAYDSWDNRTGDIYE